MQEVRCGFKTKWAFDRLDNTLVHFSKVLHTTTTLRAHCKYSTAPTKGHCLFMETNWALNKGG